MFNVLDFCDRRTRSHFLTLTKRYCKILTSDASFRWRLQRLHIEKGLFFPDELPSTQTSWRSLFLDLDKKRQLWDADCVEGVSATDENDGDDKYSISVYTRFKPITADCNRIQNDRKIVLPLHQRLALIRINKGLASNTDALSVLKGKIVRYSEKSKTSKLTSVFFRV